MSPRLSEAIKRYTTYRNPLPEFSDYLIIIPEGRYKGMKPGEQATFIKNITKKIAIMSVITKHVTPYIVKPSAITNDFNSNVNPKIIQRKARHKNIKSTLIYDHTDDEMVRKHFELQHMNTKNMDKNDKGKILLDYLLQGEIDFATFKEGIIFLQWFQEQLLDENKTFFIN